jgi:hypothetical protein
LDGRRDVATVVELTGLSRLDVCRTVYGLLLMGVIIRRAAPSAAAVGGAA